MYKILILLFLIAIPLFVVTWSISATTLQSNEAALNMFETTPPSKKNVEINVVETNTSTTIEFRNMASTSSITIEDNANNNEIEISLPTVPGLAPATYGSENIKITALVNEKGLVQSVNISILGGIQSVQGATGSVDIMMIDGNNIEFIPMPETNSIKVRVIDHPNITSIDAMGIVKFEGNVTCNKPVETSCIDISGTTCSTPVASTCLPNAAMLTSFHANNLTVENLVMVQVSNQTDLIVENIQSTETTIMGSFTCLESSLDSDCIDFSSYTCSVGTLDNTCLPPSVVFENVGVTNTLSLGGSSTPCDNAVFDASCNSIDAYECDIESFDDSCIPDRVTTINGISPNNALSYTILGGPLINIEEIPNMDESFTLMGTNWLFGATVADTLGHWLPFYASVDKLVDGVITGEQRGWIGGGEGTVSNQLPAIADIDMGTAQSVGFIRVLGWHGGTSLSAALSGTRNYRISVSEDGVEYYIIGKGEIAELDTTTWYGHRFKNRSVRFVRFYCDTHWTNVCALAEIEAYTLVESGPSSELRISTTAEANMIEPSCNSARSIIDDAISDSTAAVYTSGTHDIHTPVISTGPTVIGAVYEKTNSVPPSFLVNAALDVRTVVYNVHMSTRGGDAGLAFGYNSGDQSNPSADYLLFLYRQPGTRLYHIQGPQIYGPAGEVDGYVWNTVIQNGTALGNTPSVINTYYNIRAEYACNRLKIFVDGVLDIDYPFEFINGGKISHVGYGSYIFRENPRYWDTLNPILKQKTGENFEFYNIGGGSNINTTSDENDNIIISLEEQNPSVAGVYTIPKIYVEASGLISSVTELSSPLLPGTNTGTLGQGPFFQVNGINYEYYNIAAGPINTMAVSTAAGGNNIEVDLRTTVTAGTYGADGNLQPDHTVNDAGKLDSVDDGFLDTGGGTYFAWGYQTVSSVAGGVIFTASTFQTSRCLVSGPSPALYDTCINAGYWDLTTFIIPEDGVYEINVWLKDDSGRRVFPSVLVNGTSINTVRTGGSDSERIFIIREFTQGETVQTLLTGSTTSTRVFWGITSFF